jgi:hypothetical protein
MKSELSERVKTLIAKAKELKDIPSQLLSESGLK